MKYPAFFILILCILISSCTSTKVVSPEEFKGNRLILSHGGGFTGKYKTYCLLENGQLFKNLTEFEATVPISPLESEVAEQIFSNYKILGLANENVVSYNNLNYSIVMINEKGEEHEIKWGHGQKEVSRLQLFYDNVMNHIKKATDKEKQTQKAQ